MTATDDADLIQLEAFLAGHDPLGHGCLIPLINPAQFGGFVPRSAGLGSARHGVWAVDGDSGFLLNRFGKGSVAKSDTDRKNN